MRKLAATLVALAVVAILLVVFFRDAVAKTALSLGGLASGYSISAGQIRLGARHGALVGVHVSRGGEPVLDAARIDVDYNPRDLLPGSRHRFGISALSIDAPHITLIHHQDGSYNVSPLGGGPAGPPGPPNRVPLDMTIRVRNATATLVDKYRFYAASRVQSLSGVDADVAINDTALTWYRVTGTLNDFGPKPFRVAGSIDARTGFALHHISAKAIPIATISNYFINSRAAEVLGGTVRNMDMRMWQYAGDALHMAGSGMLADGRMNVHGMDAPIAQLAGRITLFDSGFAADHMGASVGHVRIQCSGGIFDFSRPQFRIGVEGSGDLRNLHEIMKIAGSLPIRGAVRIHALIAGDLSSPVLLVGFDGKHWDYGSVPLENPNGQVALLNDRLIILPFHATYGAMKMHVQGSLQLGKQVHSTLALHAYGPSARIPYLGALVPDQPIVLEALLGGDDLKVDVRGYLVSLTDPANVNAFYSLNRYGEGAFGPMQLREPAGGTLVAGFSLDREHGNSAFWASVHDMRLREPQPIRLPGVTIPELPPMDAQIQTANIAGTGSSNHVVIGGRVAMSPASIAGVPFDRVNAAFAGPFSESRLSSVQASGPWGSFEGGGTFGTGIIAARGNYHGTLQGLHMFLGGLKAQGSVDGPVGIAIAGGKIFVQVQNAQLANADIQGIPISQMSGTMSFANNMMRIYAARAAAAGGNVDVAGTFATGVSHTQSALALVTSPLRASALHSLGVPLSTGTLQAAGTMSPSRSIPNLNAGVVVQNGNLLGYAPFNITSEMELRNGSLQLSRGVASLGTTIADVDGSVAGITSGAPVYDLLATVPAGDIASAAAMMHLPSYHADGSFDGNLRIGGAGVKPVVNGSVRIPEATVNGMGVRDGSAQIAVSGGGGDVRNGAITIGESRVQFGAAVHPSVLAFSMHAAHADLSDFNDYFDTGDTLAGTGSVNVAFSHFNNLTFTSGNVDIDNFRFRRLPIGNTDAHWNGVRNIVQGTVAVGGEHGLLDANGTIGFAPSTSLGGIVAGSRYDLNAKLQNFDLATWLPALGYPQLPVTGRVDGTASVRGSYPHLQLGMDASARNGTFGPFTVTQALVRAQTAGDRINVTQLVFALPSLEATGTGSFGLTAAAPVDLRVHGATSDLAGLISQATKQRLPITGSFESTVTIGGTLHAPRFTAALAGTNVNAYGIQMPALLGEVELANRSMLLRNAHFTFVHGSATIAGTLPITLQPFAFGSPNAPMAMDLTADAIDLSAFQQYLGNDTKLGGTLSGHIGVNGFIGSPRIYGDLSATNVSYTSALETTPITHTVAQMSFTGTTATLSRLHANLGSGSLDGSGSLNFGGGIESGPLAYGISAKTHAAQMSSPLFGSATFDSNVHLTRVPGKLAVISGTVGIPDAVIPLSAFLQLAGGPNAGTAPSGPPLNVGFDLTIKSGKNVRVRGGGAGLFGLDIGGTGQVHLAGTLQQPTLEGTFNSSGGTLTYIDHAFRIQQGTVTFTPANGVLPDLYALATTHVNNPDPNTARNPTGYADITARVTGVVPNVKVAFSSNPPGYTDQQIIALLLPFNGLVGPVQFTETGAILPAGTLAGAPLPGTGGLLPGVFQQRQNGTVTIGQEAFNILNTQFASGILSPITSALGNTLGLSDVGLTVDYSGNVGLDVRRLLGANVYAVYGTTFAVPIRQTFGVAYQPTAFTSAQFTTFWQQGETPLFLAPNQTLSSNPRASAGQPLTGSNGFTFLFQRLF